MGRAANRVWAGQRSKQVRSLFDKLDVDRDGVVDRDELTHAIANSTTLGEFGEVTFRSQHPSVVLLRPCPSINPNLH